MGSVIKERRRELKLTIDELAEAAKVSRRSLISWEQSGAGKARAASLARVAEVLGCTVDEILKEG